MRRVWGVTAVVLIALVLVPASAVAAWSALQQVKGFSGVSGVVVGVDETGTVALGISGSGFASYVERPPGLAEWNSSGVKITNITGAPSATSWALSSSGAALVTWGEKAIPMVAFKPAGGSWGAAVPLDSINAFDQPIPLIDEAGHPAVVWTRKAGSPTLNMPDQVVYSSPTGSTWPASPTKLADITTPVPKVGNAEAGFKFNGCPVELHAAMLPGGTPVASWNDAYGSWKQTGVANPEFEIALCSVRAASGGAQVDVTPRPAVGWFAAPAGNMPNWTQISVVASPTNTKTAIVMRGREDSLQFSGCGEADACYSQERETRIALGTGATLALAGSNLLGIKEVASVALRNDRTLVVSKGPLSVARAGVGSGFPTLTALPTDFTLLSAGLSLNDAGVAHIGAISDNITTIGLRLFDAPAAGAFAGPQVVDSSSGASRTPSLALDCKGLPVMAWSRSASNQAFTSNFDAAPSVCGEGPDPEPEASGGGQGGGGSPAGPTVTDTPPPVPSSLAKIADPAVDPNGSKVSFKITCSPLTDNACGGKVVITKVNNSSKARIAAQAGAVLGSLKFAGLKPGKSKTLKVPLIKSAKQALASGKSIKAVITASVHDGAGNTRVTTKRATLKLRG